MKVPFVDVQGINSRHRQDFDNVYDRVIRSGRFLFGIETESFEREYAAYCRSTYCVCVANGLDALTLTLQAWIRLGRLSIGDAVIVPANSFVASALAVKRAGLRVRFADVDSTSYNMSVAKLRAAMSGDVRAVMPVHLYGQLVDLEGIRRFCDEQGLLLLEDAAQAHGAKSADDTRHPTGDAAAYSFYPSKNLGALADAGCVVTQDMELATTIRALGNYGGLRKYEHELQGTNSRIDELNAGFLRIKLQSLDQDNEARRDVADQYLERIAHSLIQLPAKPQRPEGHVWHLFVVETPHRERLIDHLRINGIESAIHYPSVIHRLPAFRSECTDVRAPVSEAAQDRILSLPMSPILQSSQIDWVVECINRWRPV